jgi:hypothetical protein
MESDSAHYLGFLPPEEENAWQYIPVDAVERFESIYAVLSRFQCVNVLSGTAIRLLFGARVRTRKGINIGLEDLASVDSWRLERLLGVSQLQIIEMFLIPRYHLFSSVTCPYLRVCPICIGSQKHYTIFQLQRLSTCPFHSVPLRTSCRFCGSQSLYQWTGTLFDAPFCCSKCQRSLAAQQGQAGFFDLKTPARSKKIDLLYAVLRKGGGVHGGLDPARAICSGYWVCCPETISDKRGNALTQLPLQDLSPIEVDWHLRSGFIQIKGAPALHRRHKGQVEAVERRDVVNALRQCLKSILRYLRKLRRRGSVQLSGGLLNSAEKELRFQREEAYRGVLYCWCGNTLDSKRTRNGLTEAVELSLDQYWERAPAFKCFQVMMPWFITHLFCGYVFDSIATVSLAVEGTSELLRGGWLEPPTIIRKPLWYVALVAPPSDISFRVIRHYQFPISLWVTGS